jgi:hypothetical protein
MAAVTQWCEPYLGDDAGDREPIICTDALELAVRALGSLQGSVRLAEYRTGPWCPGTRCAPSTDAAHVLLASDLAGVLVVEVRRVDGDGLAVWPAVAGASLPRPPPFDPPLVQRPALEDAPAELQGRDPYPFCGTLAAFAAEGAAAACFVTAVRAGSPAELIQDGFTVEGDPVRTVYRFHGSGAVEAWHDGTRDSLGPGLWSSRTCAMYRLEEPGAFSCG